MKSQEIRETFLTFFKQKNHKIVASAPMVIKNDPTLMFTNAGMNQFKDLFLGNSPIMDKRIADTQKCLRVSGKHNDLEEVGVDTYHHTMFEMLGNWSFGDYFKKEAIEWAWELLVEVYKIDKNRLYFTVFEGDVEDGTPEDKEAFELWKDLLEKNGLTTDKILKANKKDNFWEMGDTGPCGPCSEIHVDIRSDEEIAKIPGKELVNNDHPQVIEIWNLVFMEFNRMADGKLKALPAKHVDTGMGFERLAMVLQGKKSNYDTDVFSPLTDKIAQISDIPYKNSLDTQYKTDVAIRVIADHVRAVAFSIADGQLPSNNGAGYVIRRILRRAIRYGYSFLNLKEAFIYELVEILAQQMGAFFPELVNQQEIITKVIKEEEDSFLRTLDKGISRFENYIATASSKNIDGRFAFELYDTFGFPIDLTQLMSTENGFKVDMAAFNHELEEQKNRSRAATKIETGDWITVQNALGTEFIGYDNLESETKIVSYRKIKAKDKEQYQIVLKKTPFYPEGGGQVGDKGYLEVNGKKIAVLDTKRENNLIVHFTKELPEDLTASVKAVVSNDRKLTAANHSATHLLHQALRTILGTHVEQKGSLVNADYLRFDFSHFQKVSEEELQQIEDFVNEKIQAAINLDEHREIPIEEAEKQGAMMLFGEKYGDKVRMIQFGDSKELCGGIHVNNTKAIELFKITSEGSVAAGIRRIEAVTSKGAANYLKEKIDTITKHPLSGLVTDEVISKINIAQHNLLQQYAKVSDMSTLNIISPSNGSLQIEVLSNAIADFTKIKLDAVIIDELNNIKKAMLKEEEQKGKEQAKAIKEELLNEVKNINGVNVITKKLTAVDAATIKDLAFQLKVQIDNLYLVLGAEINGKPNLTIAISDNLATERKLHAGNIIREAAKEMQGGGGGQPFFATAGGANLNGLDAAMEKALAVLN
ncbi:MAG: alanine--tRNA ligase [Flavobacteriales bacterium]|nr:alanine--tRNA ligase [Flavobacteriales bacterium]|tara:strand:- start:9055 stop:11844 length:2790 start_codon:yes stop_codon:yes gene_type:complete